MAENLDIKFVNLADQPESIALVAKWYYDEWGRLSTSSSFESTLEKVSTQSNKDRIPLHVLGLAGSKVVGVIQLKFQENKTYPKGSHWIGGVYVASEARGKGVGEALVSKISEVAKSFEVRELYLQTERQDGGVYSKCGFQPIETVMYNGMDVLVMRKILR